MSLRPKVNPSAPMIARRLRGHFVSALCFALLCAMVPSCAARQPFMTTERMERGLVIVLTGVEGRSPFNEAICEGLDAGGVGWAIELYDWTSWLGPAYSHRAEGRNRDKAADFASRIVRYRMTYPGRPVVLVGQSAGGAMAVWTAEAMPPGYDVDGLILLAASLSPSYMLDKALENSRRGIVSFHSELDWVFLGVATTLVGTMDGQHTSSAGRVGFALPEGPARGRLYEKLSQVPWRQEMTRTGHVGMHVTSGAAGWVRQYVAPLALAERWDAETIESVLPRPPTTGPAVRWPSWPASVPSLLP